MSEVDLERYGYLGEPVKANPKIEMDPRRRIEVIYKQAIPDAVCGAPEDIERAYCSIIRNINSGRKLLNRIDNPSEREDLQRKLEEIKEWSLSEVAKIEATQKLIMNGDEKYAERRKMHRFK